MPVVSGFSWDDKDALGKVDESGQETYKYTDSGLSIRVSGREPEERVSREKGELSVSTGYGLPQSTEVTWDGEILEISRQEIGSPELYYTETTRGIVFSTDLGVVLKFLEEPLLEEKVLDSYIGYRFNAFPGKTVFANVRKLPPNTSLVYKDGDTVTRELGETAAKYSRKELQETLETAVKEQAEKDSAILLSGGIDSSFLAALLAEKDIKAYTYDIDGAADKAREVAEALEIKHEVVPRIEKPFETLSQVIEANSQPVMDATALPLKQLVDATEEEKVFAGLGIDEQFAGYEIDRGCHYLESYGRVIPSRATRTAVKYLPVNSLFRALTGNEKKFGEEMRQRLSKSLNPGNVVETYENLQSVFPPEERKELYAEIESAQKIEHLRNLREGERKAIGAFERFEQDTKVPDQEIRPLISLFQGTSSEPRFPFLDRRVLALTQNMPVDEKVKHFRGKKAFREIASETLSPTTASTKKTHFSPDLGEWLSGHTLEKTKQVLSPERLEKHGYFRTRKVEKLLENTGKSPFFTRRKIWVLLAFQLWYEKHIEGFGEIYQLKGEA